MRTVFKRSLMHCVVWMIILLNRMSGLGFHLLLHCESLTAIAIQVQEASQNLRLKCVPPPGPNPHPVPHPRQSAVPWTRKGDVTVVKWVSHRIHNTLLDLLSRAPWQVELFRLGCFFSDFFIKGMDFPGKVYVSLSVEIGTSSDAGKDSSNEVKHEI